MSPPSASWPVSSLPCGRGSSSTPPGEARGKGRQRGQGDEESPARPKAKVCLGMSSGKEGGTTKHWGV